MLRALMALKPWEVAVYFKNHFIGNVFAGKGKAGMKAWEAAVCFKNHLIWNVFAGKGKAGMKAWEGVVSFKHHFIGNVIPGKTQADRDLGVISHSGAEVQDLQETNGKHLLALLSLMLGIVLALICTVVIAAEEVNESSAAMLDGFVSIKVVRGEVDIHGWDRAEIKVTGTLDERTEEFIFDVQNEEAIIRVEIEDDSSWFRWSDAKGSDLDIFLPETSRLDMSGGSVDVSVQGLVGELDLSLVSGDLEVKDVQGEVQLQTVSGDMDIQQVAGDIEIQSVSGDVKSRMIEGSGEYSSVSGDIEIWHAGRDLDVETVTGDIEILADVIDELNGQSISGDVEIAGRLLATGQIRLDTVSGSINLALAGKLNIKLDLETRDGSIRNKITDDRPRRSEHSDKESLRFSLNEDDGSEGRDDDRDMAISKVSNRADYDGKVRHKGRVTLATRSGDITISRHDD